jgi:long-subunit acyl-CoA synthetase (AMP-forming)
MEVTSAAAARTGRPAGLDAATLAEAFQLTAQAHPERVALRTKDDEFSMTWGEYADKVRAIAAGLAALGLERGGALAIMLTNRPEFHPSTRRRCISAPRRSPSTTPTPRSRSPTR